MFDSDDDKASQGLRADVRLARMGADIALQSADPATRAKLPALLSIVARLEARPTAQTSPLDRLLPEFLLDNPDILRAVFERSAREILDFVARVCEHYRGVAQQRALTDQEKSIGAGLLRLLDTLSASGDAGDHPAPKT